MPYVKRKRSPAGEVMLRVAATVRFNHLSCRVRNCHRENRCTGRTGRLGFPFCIQAMPYAQIEEMLMFVEETSDLATPEMVAEHLKLAATQDERRMIEFRRNVFLYYYATMAEEGLVEPLGPPFTDG